MNKAETVRIAKLGKKELRLVKQGMRYFGMADGQRCSESENADTAWQQLHENAGKSDPKYFGLGEARIRFLKFFPNGFHSDGYAEQERNYKVAAKVKLDEAVPPEMAVAGVGLGEDILGVFRATNLLSPFEKTRLQDLLRGSYADAFVQAVARFALAGC